MDFSKVGDALVAEGHGHELADLRASVGNAAGFSETWYSDEHGFGHDCSQHRDVDESLWAPGCHNGGFRPVTVAMGVPPEVKVERAS